MKKLILLCLVAVNAFAQNLPVEIQIKLTHKEAKGKVYLEQLNDRGFAEKKDSVEIKAEPFLFKTQIEEPGIYQLNIGNEQLIGLLLDGGEKINVVADGIVDDDKAAKAVIDGSPTMKVFQELQSDHIVFTNKVREIDTKFKSTSNESSRQKLRDQYLNLLKEHNQNILDKVKSLGT